jgi:Tol biopolymer transport system component
LSPDGRYIAYSALATDPGKGTGRYAVSLAVPDQHIYILSTDGSGRETELVKGANINEYPVWMPDSSRILFVSNRSGGGFGLWSVGVKDGQMTESPAPVRTSITGRVQLVGMTAKGSLYYIPPRAEGSGTDVFVARIDPSTGKAFDPVVRPIDNFSGRNLSPAWSPDERFIAFMRQRPVENTFNNPEAFEVVVYDCEKGTEKEYPGITYIDGSTPPIWFHDGKGLLVRRNYDGGQMFRIDMESGEYRSIEATSHSAFPSGWRKALLAPDNP